VTTLATPEAAPEAAPTPSAPSSAWALVRLLGALALITGVFLVSASATSCSSSR